MKTVLLLFALLTTAALDGQAQQAPASTPTPTLATHADTVALIHQVFRRARRFGRLGSIAEGLGVGSQVLVLTATEGDLSPAGRTLAFTATAGYTFFLFKFLGEWRHFSKRREAQAIQRFELHQPQPLYVQRRLVVLLLAGRRP